MASSARQIDETVILQTFSRYVRVIEKYSGPDPLQPWFEYFSWIERTFSINYKQDEIIDDLLVRCLAKFEHLKHYYQDRRLIKIFIKYVRNLKMNRFQLIDVKCKLNCCCNMHFNSSPDFVSRRRAVFLFFSNALSRCWDKGGRFICELGIYTLGQRRFEKC